MAHCQGNMTKHDSPCIPQLKTVRKFCQSLDVIIKKLVGNNRQTKDVLYAKTLAF